jgi:hypothetical protein
MALLSIDAERGALRTAFVKPAARAVRISGERLAALWRASSMSQESFAHAIGMKRSGLFRLMRPGEHGMFTDNFRRLAEAVGVTPRNLRARIGAGEDAVTIEPAATVDSMSGVVGAVEAVRQITTFHGVSAGPRGERLDVAHGQVKVPRELGEFAVRVDGESMSPEYPHQAVALFEMVDGQQFVFGKEHLIWFEDGECYFSRVVESNEDRDVLVFQKLNPDKSRFPDCTVHRREVARVARCVGVVIRKG